MPSTALPLVHVMSYGPGVAEEHTPATVGEARDLVGRRPVTWINVNANTDPGVLRDLENAFGFHPLAIEDVKNARQRPKMEEYEDYLFIVLRMAYYEEGRLRTEQLCVFLAKDFVLTVQETRGDDFDPIRERIRTGRGQIREKGPDYLCYALADTLVDSLFPILEKIGESVEEVEDEMSESPTAEARDRLGRFMKELLVIRRFAWPQREAIALLEREGPPFVTEETRVYLRDVVDHTIRTIDIIEAHRELAAEARDLYLTGLNMRLNEVIKLLTIISTIFIPLTFITSVYGMNFDTSAGPLNMPELHSPYGYVSVLAAMGGLTALMLVYFRRRGWI